jgi:NADPH:quinone reductase-like Zn-dependent oxidoreductase
MKAVVITGYGGVDRLELREAADPEPAEGGVVVRVRAAALNPLDWKIRRGMLRIVWRIHFPFVPGFDVAGEVESAPVNSRWRAGERVFASSDHGGGLAERIAVRGSFLARIPERMSFEEAAAVPAAGCTALLALRDSCRVREGARVLVNGASGGVGTFAVQIARALGATVDGVASSHNHELVRGLGASRTIDYEHEDFTRERGAWDAIFDAVATRTFRRCLPALRPKGVYCTTMPGPGPFFDMAATRLMPFAFGGRRATWVVVRPSGDNLETLASWIVQGKIRPVVERVVPLRIDDVRAAFEHLESGHARGKIVVRT